MSTRAPRPTRAARATCYSNTSRRSIKRMRNEETSYPRERVKILLLENVSQSAADEFTSRGYASVERLSRALGEDELVEAVRGTHILGIRSKTRVTERVLAAADKLLAIGCFCIGVNQVDLKSAATAGVA